MYVTARGSKYPKILRTSYRVTLVVCDLVGLT